jgi:hypothetical protein
MVSGEGLYGGGGQDSQDMITGDIFQLLYFCFASFCYHFGFIIQTLPKKNKLHASPFLTGIPNFAKEKATVWFP